MRNILTLWIFLIKILSVIVALPAWAARGAVVEDVDTKVYETPSKTSRVIETLAAKTEIAVSNLPTSGFHKVRTPSGEIGWIQASSLVLQDPPTAEELVEAGAPDPKEEEKASEEEKRERKLLEKPGYIKYRGRIRLLGNYNLFTASGIIVNFDGISNGYSYGGEIGFMVSSRTAIVFRVENLSKSVGLADNASSKLFQLDLASLPVMAGLSFTIAQGPRAALQLDFLGGLALNSKVVSTNLTDIPSAISNSSGTGMTGVGKVNVIWQFSKYFSGVIEGGYRYLSVSSLAPTAGNGSLILNSTFNLNLSGPFVGGGFGLNF